MLGEIGKQQQQQRGGAAWAVIDEKWGGTAPHSHCMLLCDRVLGMIA